MREQPSTGLTNMIDLSDMGNNTLTLTGHLNLILILEGIGAVGKGWGLAFRR